MKPQERKKMKELFSTSFPYWHFIIRAIIVFVFVLIMLRLGGKRQIGQMGTGEFVAILLISNAVQNSMNGGDNSITGGMILSIVIISLSVFVAYITYKSKKIENIIQGSPTLLIHKGRILHKHLEKELLNIHELRVLLRKQGIHNLDEIGEAVLESDGYISVIKKSEYESENNYNES